jgi:hypothetical protein
MPRLLPAARCLAAHKDRVCFVLANKLGVWCSFVPEGLHLVSALFCVCEQICTSDGVWLCSECSCLGMLSLPTSQLSPLHCVGCESWGIACFHGLIKAAGLHSACAQPLHSLTMTVQDMFHAGLSSKLVLHAPECDKLCCFI